ncbi:MAG: endonuclease VII domain-containing protein [Armatimonadetes bacterium]|nr:endonuclease VII domain-containing protein [Armatimonadota bacterium]
MVTRYGVELTDYESLLMAQRYVCAICGNPETLQRNGETQRLSVDHCHLSGLVRGLLCSACNIGLSRFKDDPELLAKAIRYLEEAKPPIRK